MSDEEKSVVIMQLAQALGWHPLRVAWLLHSAVDDGAAIEALRAEPVTYLVRHEGANRHARRTALREVER